MSEDPSGTGDSKIPGESGPYGSLISPSVSIDSVSTTGSVMTRQSTAGIAIIERILSSQGFDRNPRTVGKSVM